MFNPKDCFTSDAIKRRSFEPYVSFNFSNNGVMKNYVRLNAPAAKYFIDNKVERVVVYVKNDKSGFYVVPSTDGKGSKVTQKHGTIDKKNQGNGIAMGCSFLAELVRTLYKGQSCKFKAVPIDEQKVLEIKFENPEFI